MTDKNADRILFCGVAFDFENYKKGVSYRKRWYVPVYKNQDGKKCMERKVSFSVEDLGDIKAMNKAILCAEYLDECLDDERMDLFWSYYGN